MGKVENSEGFYVAAGFSDDSIMVSICFLKFIINL